MSKKVLIISISILIVFFTYQHFKVKEIKRYYLYYIHPECKDIIIHNYNTDRTSYTTSKDSVIYYIKKDGCLTQYIELRGSGYQKNIREIAVRQFFYYDFEQKKVLEEIKVNPNYIRDQCKPFTLYNIIFIDTTLARKKYPTYKHIKWKACKCSDSLDINSKVRGNMLFYLVPLGDTLYKWYD